MAWAYEIAGRTYFAYHPYNVPRNKDGTPLGKNIRKVDMRKFSGNLINTKYGYTRP